MKSDFVIIIPCFNEEKRFDQEHFRNLLKIENVSWIFVNDGSTDGTQTLLDSFCKRYGAKLIQLTLNQGKSEAIRSGLISAHRWFPEAVWFGYLDADGAFDVADIAKLQKIASQDSHDADAYFSSRVKLSGRKIIRKSYRHAIGRVIVTYFSFFVEGLPYDTQTGYKLFKASEMFSQSIQTKFKTKWFIDIELIIRMSKINTKLINIWEEPVSSWCDISGSKIDAGEILRLIREILYIQFTLMSFKKRISDS